MDFDRGRWRRWGWLGLVCLAMVSWPRRHSPLPVYARVLHHRGEEALGRGRMFKAQGDCHQALSHDPEFFPAWICQGRADRALGRWAAAQHALEQAARVNPSSFEPEKELGILFYQRGQTDQARVFLARALEKADFAEMPEIVYYQGLCDVQNNERREVFSQAARLRKLDRPDLARRLEEAIRRPSD